MTNLYQKYFREQIAEPPFDTQLMRWLLSYLRPHWVASLFSVLFLVVAKSIEAVVPFYVGYTAQQVIDGSVQFSLVLQHGLSIIALLFVAYFLDSISLLLKNWSGQNAIYTLRTEVYQHIQHLPLSYFDRTPIGKLMTRTIHDIDQISQMLSESIIPLFGSLILLICITISILVMDWRIGILFIAICPIIAWLTNRFRIDQRYWYEILRNIVAVMNTFIQEYLLGSSTIRNFGLQQQEKKQFDETNEDFRIASFETTRYFSFFIASIDFLQSFVMICAFAILSWTISPVSGFSVGVFLAFSLYITMLFRPLADLSERYNVLQSALAAASRLSAILNIPIEPASKVPTTLPEVHSIVFDDVWFAYEEENWILKGLSFTVERGDSVALVGITGAGKTTIISLLLRFYDFQKGSIKVNGRDIREYSLSTLRSLFSVVLQDPVIFSGTIYENIALYQPRISRADVEAAIDYVHLRPMIQKLPKGIDHKLLERGKSLSVGEMQLISLARAVAHKRSVFILDEATANIDTLTEEWIQKTLRKVTQEKTAIMIAHRLSTIKDANKILVLHQGILVEKGTHQELLAKKGFYEKLYRVQFIPET